MRTDTTDITSPINITSLEEFFNSMLSGTGRGEYRKDRYTVALTLDQIEPTDEQKQTITITLQNDVKTLRTMLDNHGIAKEQVSDLIIRNWERLINCAPPEIISAVLTHSKAIEVQKIKSQKNGPSLLFSQFVLNTFMHRTYPTYYGNAFSVVPMSADRAGPAMVAISRNRYFELTRGADELRKTIANLNGIIRHSESNSDSSLFRIDVTSETRDIAVLKTRLQEIEETDLTVLLGLYGNAHANLTDIQEQQKSNSSFKHNLEQCISQIETIFHPSSMDQHTNAHRSDIKIRRIVQALIDTYNKITASTKGRSVFGLFGGSTTASRIKILLQDIQSTLSGYPNYTFTLTRTESEKIVLRWTEELKDNSAKLAITDDPSSTLQSLR